MENFRYVLPSDLAKILYNTSWKHIDAPYSGASTYHIQGELTGYLKILPVGHREPLRNYRDRLLWLKGKLADGIISGFIDLADAGISDKYRDLSAIHRSLIRNFGAEWVNSFYEEYGMIEVDFEKLKFYDLVECLACG